MTLHHAQEVLSNIAAWEIDNGPRGEEEREAIKIAIAAIDVSKNFLELFHFGVLPEIVENVVMKEGTEKSDG